MSNESPATDSPILLDLNSVQREAVRHPGGPLLILAGAGSGKTRVLTRRIAYLVRERGVHPAHILALTFTNKAAGEMSRRVEELLARPVRGLWIGTFHSICLRWLRIHATEAGYRPGLSVFDTDDQRALMRRLLKSEGFEQEPRRAREALGMISRAKSRGWDAARMETAAHTPAQVVSARIFSAYQAELQRQNAVDFDDLLAVSLRLFQERESIADRYAEQFEHVLVDEYQDTNHVQFKLVERLSQQRRNIFVVGDDDQSIYGWRGADVSNITDFREHFHDASVLRLEQNYRSTTPILTLANAAICRNESRWEKRLWTERTGGERPEFFLANDEDEEAEEIARRIVRAVEQNGRRYGGISVFYRTHAQSRPLEDAFLRSSIPYVLVGGVYFYQRKEVKDLLAYMRILVNPLDEVSLRRALAVPRRGIGEQTVTALLATARESGRDPLAVAAAGECDRARGKAKEKLGVFGRALLDWRDRLAEPPELLLTEIVTAIGYREYLQSQGEDWEDRAANVEELIGGARLFSSAHGGGVREYLDQISLLTDLDLVKDQVERVTLMTVHNAKGLEFPQVFVTGLEEGLFPHVSAFDDTGEMEEERRLFYVACTRAMDVLTLSAAYLRRRITAAAGGVSRFIGEIDPELYVEADLPAATWSRPLRAQRSLPERQPRPATPPGGPTPPSAETDSLDHPQVGRRVFHATFGPGIVVAAEGAGERARVTVRFHSGTTRKLVSGYLEWEP